MRRLAHYRSCLYMMNAYLRLIERTLLGFLGVKSKAERIQVVKFWWAG